MKIEAIGNKMIININNYKDCLKSQGLVKFVTQ